MWQVEGFCRRRAKVNVLPMLSGEAAQSVFDGDYDEIEIRQEWQDGNTLHQLGRGNFSLSHRWIPRKDAQQLMKGINVHHHTGHDDECLSAAARYRKPGRMADQVDRDVTRGGVTHVPLHTGIILVAMPCPGIVRLNDAAQPLSKVTIMLHPIKTHLLPLP